MTLPQINWSVGEGETPPSNSCPVDAFSSLASRSLSRTTLGNVPAPLIWGIRQHQCPSIPTTRPTLTKTHSDLDDRSADVVETASAGIGSRHGAGGRSIGRRVLVAWQTSDRVSEQPLRPKSSSVDAAGCRRPRSDAVVRVVDNDADGGRRLRRSVIQLVSVAFHRRLATVGVRVRRLLVAVARQRRFQRTCHNPSINPSIL